MGECGDSQQVVLLTMQFTHGNLLDADAEALVNTVNTVGVMGKGIALQFKDRFPDNFRTYEAACKSGEVEVGRMFITETGAMLGPRWIVNFPTKKHWRNPSKLEWVEAGLKDLAREIVTRGIRSIAIPPLGAGNGGLAWAKVRPLIEQALGALPVEVIVFEPTDAYQNAGAKAGAETLTPARALMAELIRRYESMGIGCTLLEAQKLAWFLQRAIGDLGLTDPLRLDFAANRYGPYADKLRHLLDNLDGSYLSSDRRIADARPLDEIRFNWDRKDTVAAYLQSDEAAAYQAALERVGGLIIGFESPFGMELLATVDWLRRKEGVPLDRDAMRAAIEDWQGADVIAAKRKARLFDKPAIGLAIDQLGRAA